MVLMLRYQKAEVMESKKISNKDIIEVALSYNTDFANVNTVYLTESSGSGFGPDGKLKIQFEPSVFSDYCDKLGIEHTCEIIGKNSRGLKTYRLTFPGGIVITNGVEGQDAEWKAFRQAREIHVSAAQLSTSWGMGQVMGFNHRIAGFKSVQEMIDTFFKHEKYQLIGMMEFIKSKKILDDLQNRNWRVFAYYYNGEGYEAQGYHIELEKNYQASIKIKK